MSESQSLYQLSRQIMIATGASLRPEEILRAVGEFWAADVCWLWYKNDRLVYDRFGHWTEQLAKQPEQPPVLADRQIMWVASTQGYLALARVEPWTASDRADLPGIAELVTIALEQMGVQQQVEAAKQSVRQVQALVDERTANSRAAKAF
jgi:hypothetical protein